MARQLDVVHSTIAVSHVVVIDDYRSVNYDIMAVDAEDLFNHRRQWTDHRYKLSRCSNKTLSLQNCSRNRKCSVIYSALQSRLRPGGGITQLSQI